MRVVIEKPFGTSLAEARELNAACSSVFDESQVFRIDHYLGKETVQNMLALRFANGIFEPLWNRNYIDHVQITAAEDIGIESRAGYYDQAGALRDLVQNHMLQLLCHVAHGAAGGLHRRRSAQREGQGAARDPAAARPRRSSEIAVRAQYARGQSVARRSPAISKRRACRRLATPRPSRRSPRGRQLALGGRALLPAHRQAPGAQGDRDRGHAQARSPPGLLADGSLGVRPNQLVLTVQPNEGVSLRSARRSRGRA